jgi:hypothetical protein
MSSRAKFYRAEADRFRAIAATSRDPVFAERYRQLAKDSIEVAESFEAMHVLAYGRPTSQPATQDGAVRRAAFNR